MSPHRRIVAALGLSLSIAAASAGPVAAQSPTLPEAVGTLLFPDAVTAMPKTSGPGSVTYRGNTQPGEPERTILRIASSLADRCLFEAAFIEAPAPAGVPGIAVTTAQLTTIDLRRPAQAALSPAAQPGAASRFVLSGKALYCSRNMILEQTPKLTLSESCLETVEDSVLPADMARKTAAFDALRLACRW